LGSRKRKEFCSRNISSASCPVPYRNKTKREHALLGSGNQGIGERDNTAPKVATGWETTREEKEGFFHLQTKANQEFFRNIFRNLARSVPLLVVHLLFNFNFNFSLVSALVFPLVSVLVSVLVLDFYLGLLSLDLDTTHGVIQVRKKTKGRGTFCRINCI
jgi:hypothetical protein